MEKGKHWKYFLIMGVGIVVTMVANEMLALFIHSERIRIFLDLLIFYFANSVFYMERKPKK